jgi:hypothetical protein
MKVKQKLLEIFLANRVQTMDALMKNLNRSRMSIHRYLEEIGYFSSYNARGMFYTLCDIPEFDNNGLWKYDQAYFSVHGNLMNTLVALVNNSQGGLTHEDLQDLVGIKMHNALLTLAKSGKILRKEIEGTFVYYSHDHNEEQVEQSYTAAMQEKKSQAVIKRRAPRTIPNVGLFEISQVLAAYIEGHIEALPLYNHLHRKGINITPKQVESIFEHYELGKKKIHLEDLLKIKDNMADLERELESSKSSSCNLPVQARSENSVCPICGALMTVSKTVFRPIQTLEYSLFHVNEQHRWCPNKCIDPETGKPVHSRSELLADIVNHGNRYGYDVEAFIGQKMYLENRQAKEIHEDLLTYGLNISESEVLLLGVKFLDHLEKVHFHNAPKLRSALEAEGGYVAHIDGTCEKGRGGMFAVLSGWNNWVLVAGKIKTEHHELIEPFLDKALDNFGPPVAFVRDMGKAMHTAIINVMGKTHTPELICHYHFNKDVGKDILSEDHDVLRKLFKKVNTKKKLRGIITNCNNIIGKREFKNDVLSWIDNPDTNANIPNGYEGIAVIRSLTQHLLDYGYDKSGKKFPFTRPYYELYNRCLSMERLLAKVITANTNLGRTYDLIALLYSIVSSVSNSESFKLSAEALMEKAYIFDKLRQTLRVDTEGGSISKAGEVEPDARSLDEMEKNLNVLIDNFQQNRDSMSENSRKAVDIILKHIEDHGKFLWGHKVVMKKSNGDTIVRYVYRCNNAIECKWRPIKRNIRRRYGCADAGYALEHVSSSICYVRNLLDQKYLDIVYGGSLKNIEKAFALYDKEHRHTSVTAPAKIRLTGSLSASDKRIIRNPKFIEKVEMKAA